MSDYFIYGLIDPRNRSVFYVGQSSRGSIEPEDYIRRAGSGKTTRLVKRYLRRLHLLGLKSEWEILEEIDLDHLDDAERFWIASIRSCGAALANMTDGGEGLKGYRLSEEQRRKRSETSHFRYPINLGRKHPKDEIERRAFSNTGKKRSPETKARISAALTGKKFSEERRLRMSISRKGKPLSDDHRLKLSLRAQEQWARRRPQSL